MRKKAQASYWLLLATLSLTALAQDSEPLDEEFLLFIAGGMEIDGEWRDPMSLMEMVELSEVPEERLADVDAADLEEANADE